MTDLLTPAETPVFPNLCDSPRRNVLCSYSLIKPRRSAPGFHSSGGEICTANWGLFGPSFSVKFLLRLPSHTGGRWLPTSFAAQWQMGWIWVLGQRGVLHVTHSCLLLCQGIDASVVWSWHASESNSACSSWGWMGGRGPSSPLIPQIVLWQ